MRKHVSVLMILLGTCVTSTAFAQQQAAPAALPSQGQQTQAPPAQTPSPAAPQAGRAGGRGQGTPVAGTFDYRLTALPNPAVNVKLELSITDTYAGTPAKKTVTMLVSNGGNGMIRTSNRLPDGSPVNLNVDCQVSVLSVMLPVAGRERGPEVIRTALTFLYTPAQASAGEGRPAPRPADLTESVNVILQDGKLTVVSQSADPATDRKVTVEVTASIIR